MISRPQLNARAAFTLIELLLVLAIMAVIGAMSAPIYSRFLTQNAVSNTVDQLVQDVRKAQFYAMTSRKSTTSGWGVRFGSQTITLYQGTSFAARNQALDETFTVNPNITVSGLTDLNFPRVSGIPVAGATITVSGMGNNKTITVNSQGMVTR